MIITLWFPAETVGYDGGACYLAEVGSVWELRARIAESMSPHAALALEPPGALRALEPPGALRARHASDGDILAPPCRPESGAFSGQIFVFSISPNTMTIPNNRCDHACLHAYNIA